MNSAMLVAVAIVVGPCCLLAYGASWFLTRRGEPLRQGTRMLISGLVPTALIIVALIVGHVRWLARHDGGYSPLVLLIYGSWLLALNIACNMAAAAFQARKR